MTYFLEGLDNKNFFEQLNPGKKDPQLVSSLVSGDNIVDENYKPLEFDTCDQIVLSTKTINLLKVICYDDPYRYSVIRGFMRTILTAKTEGQDWKSALYIDGPSNCGKSLLIELFSLLATNSSYIKKLSKTHNQLTSGQLENCRLLIVSD